VTSFHQGTCRPDEHKEESYLEKSVFMFWLQISNNLLSFDSILIARNLNDLIQLDVEDLIKLRLTNSIPFFNIGKKKEHEFVGFQ
jgi:hypothetical protein